MKRVIYVLAIFFSSLAYGACSDYHSNGSCISPCVWLTGGGGRCSDPVNTAPTNISLSPSSVAENSASGTAVGTFTTTDTAGNTHTYTLVSGTGSTDNASFTISGNQLLTNAIFNYEVKTSYSIRVRTTDQGGLFFEKAFTITVSNVNEAPAVTSGASASVNETIPVSTVIYTITATDPDAGQTLTYSIGGTDAAYFNVNATTGAITFKASPDFETKSSYSITVTATDNGSPLLSASKAVTISINNLNETPTNISLDNASVAENQPSGTTVGNLSTTDPDTGNTFTYSIVGGDAASFSISGNQLKTAASFDYETKNSYSVTIRSTDQGGLTFDKIFTVSITNVNEAPTITAPNSGNAYSANVAENTTSVADVDATDIEGSTLTYSLSGTDAARFTINSTTGVVTFTTAPDFETPSDVGGNNVYDFIVTVSDGSLSDTQDFNITVTNANEPPVITAPNSGNAYSANVAENTTAVADVDAINPDAGQTLTYSLSGTDASKFTINSTTGIVTFTSAPDYENPTDSGGDNIYNFTVTVSDNGSPVLTDTQTFTITITDVNEFPVADYRLEEPSWSGTVGEVKDSSGNNLNGTAIGSPKPIPITTLPARTGNPGTCGYGSFPGPWTNGGAITIDNLPVSTATGAKTTVSFWMKWNGTNSVMPIGWNRYDLWLVSNNFGFNTDNSDVYGIASTGLANRWVHVVATFTNGSVTTNALYIDGVKQTLTQRQGTPNNTTAKVQSTLYISGWQYTTNYRFSGSIDEVKVFNSALSQSQVTTLYNETHPCTGITPACTSFTYTLYHPTSTANKLQTRIAQQPFDLNISVACTSGSDPMPDRQIKKIYALTGTCPAATTGLPVLWNSSADINNTAKTITLSGLNSSKAYSNIKLMLETNASEFNCSADNMAIRPASYTISSPASPIKAADFTLQIAATDSGGGYNGTASVSTGLQTLNPNCPVSSGFVKSNLGAAEPLSITFQNDINVSAMKATDVGAIYLNTKDSVWTAIDQPNDCISDSNATIANVQGLFGCNIESNLSLVIIPNNFEVNGTLTNAEGGMFTYLSNDLNMSAQLDLNITAKNSEGNTTKNYDKGCYAKSTTLTLPHSAVPSPLTKIFYAESLSGIASNVPKNNDINLTDLSNTIFTQGAAPLAMRLNFDRNSSQPLNPFDFNITSANVVDSDGVSGTGTPVGNAAFVYGRARPYDVATNAGFAPNPVEFEVYSTVPTGYVSPMPQNVLKWYRNLNHTAAAQGNVLRGGFSAGTTDSAVNVSSPPQSGTQIVTVTSAADKTVHLDISPWLWYSPNPAKIYNYGTDCSQHPCFLYDYTSAAAGVSGVRSGTFQGSDFEMAPAQNITNKGVKVFR